VSERRKEETISEKESTKPFCYNTSGLHLGRNSLSQQNIFKLRNKISNSLTYVIGAHHRRHGLRQHHIVSLAAIVSWHQNVLLGSNQTRIVYPRPSLWCRSTFQISTILLSKLMRAYRCYKTIHKYLWRLSAECRPEVFVFTKFRSAHNPQFQRLKDPTSSSRPHRAFLITK